MKQLPHWPPTKEKALIKPGLDTILQLMHALSNPHLKLPPVIHVTGTNGKGSTVAFINHILKAAGYNTHVYTSPHLIRFNERISISGNEIDDGFLFEVIEKTRIASQENNIFPTFFEATTAAAFLAFSQVPADFLIIETGLGARIDATNIIAEPLVTIITSVSNDHNEYLGNSLRDIAYQKAGIIKKNTSCIVSKQYDEVFEVIEDEANKLNSELFAFEYDWIIYKKNQKIFFESQKRNIEINKLGLEGDHQIMNAGNAIAGLLQIPSLRLSDKEINDGLANTFWPCRIQKLLDGSLISKLPNTWEIIVDGAHNENGAYVLGEWIKQSGKKIHLIFGMSKGREVIPFIEKIYHLVEDIYVVGIEAEPLSYSNVEMHNILNNDNITNILCENIEDAINKILLDHKDEQNATILFCGSLYLAANVVYLNQAMRK